MSGENAAIIGEFIAGTAERTLPENVRDAAHRSLVDWMGVTVAGAQEQVAQAVLRYSGVEKIPTLGGCDPEKAALANGTAAHALDFDDTHILTDSHLSAVIWAALLALAKPETEAGTRLIHAFVAGYEVAAKLAGRRVGFSMQFRWFHPSGVLGHLASAAAVAAYEGLDATRAAQALALAATQAAGLRGTLGSMAKPVQVGRAAMNGIVNVRMAQAGIVTGLDILDCNGSFVRAFVQDGSAQLVSLRTDDLGSDWAVLRASFKPYACLHGIHPSIDAARKFVTDPEDIVAIRVYVAPGVKQVAKFSMPETPLQAKFSVEYCVALALTGYEVGAADFSATRLSDPRVRRLMELVETLPEEGRKMLDSAVEVNLIDGACSRRETTLSRGHPGNPMSWMELEAKFLSLVEPILGSRTSPLLVLLRHFELPDAVRKIKILLEC